MRLRIGSGFGVPIYVHWTFLLLPLLILWLHPSDSPTELPLVFTVVALSFVCVVLHEFGHVLMARFFGIGTQDVTLYPIGGVARLKKMTEKPGEEMLIAVAGPAVNVLLAIILFVCLLPFAAMDIDQVMQTFAGRIAFLLLLFNAAMVPFNLLPAFPMDGGRVLRALLSMCLGHERGTRIAVGVGTGVAILLGTLGAFYTGNYMLVVIAAFVIFAGQQELLAIRYREHQRRQWEEEEPLMVLPVRPAWPSQHPAAAPSAPPLLMLQPRISVYTWDNQTGTWRKEPGT